MLIPLPFQRRTPLNQNAPATTLGWQKLRYTAVCPHAPYGGCLTVATLSVTEASGGVMAGSTTGSTKQPLPQHPTFGKSTVS